MGWLSNARPERRPRDRRGFPSRDDRGRQVHDQRVADERRTRESASLEPTRDRLRRWLRGGDGL
jgi:hypothetical protein